MENRIVAHFVDGRTVKGVSLDVHPGKPICHVRTEERGMVEIALAELKALFFVRDLTGNAQRQEAQAVDPGDARSRGSTPIEIRFRDGERVVGLTNRYPPLGDFFFVLPADPASNNLRVLVNRAAIGTMQPCNL